MNETELLESTVSEYKNLFKLAKVKVNEKLDTERIVSKLSKGHDWTLQGANAIVCMANEDRSVHVTKRACSCYRSWKRRRQSGVLMDTC